MAGEIKKLIDIIVSKRSNGNPTLIMTTKTKLALKGINYSSYNDSSPDDPEIIEKLKKFALEIGVDILNNK